VDLLVLRYSILESSFGFILKQLERSEKREILEQDIPQDLALRVYEIVKKSCDLAMSYYGFCKKQKQKKIVSKELIGVAV